MSDPEDRDYDYPCSRRKTPTRCVCGDDLPGYCPGVLNCPYSGYEIPQGEENE